MNAAKLFGIAIAVLGALNFVFGFLPQVTASRLDQSLSVYAVGPGYVPILLLIAGLLALAAFLPGSERSRLAVAAVSVGGAVGAVISLGTTGSVELLTTAQVGKGLGAVLLTIFGIIQAVVAIAAYVVGAEFGPRSTLATVTNDHAAGSTAPRFAPPPDGATVWTSEGPVRSTPWSAPEPPAPSPTGSVAYYAGYAPVPGGTTGSSAGSGPAPGWAPPPDDDDRPTGPQPVVDLSTAAPPDHSRPGPAERELPRVAPMDPDSPSAPTTQLRLREAAEGAQQPGDTSASGPTEAYPVPPRPPSPGEPDRT